MKKNNLFVNGKKVALLALLAASLNANANQLTDGIESKQSRRDKIVWGLTSLVGVCSVIYFMKDFDRNKEK